MAHAKLGEVVVLVSGGVVFVGILTRPLTHFTRDVALSSVRILDLWKCDGLGAEEAAAVLAQRGLQAMWALRAPVREMRFRQFSILVTADEAYKA